MDVGSLSAVGGNSVQTNGYQTSGYQKNLYESDSQSLSAKLAEKSGEDNASVVEKSKKTEQLTGKSNKNNEKDGLKSYKDDPEDEKSVEFIRDLENAIKAANKELKPTNKSLSYSVHEKTKEIMITIRDDETGKVIKEIPSEESLDRIAQMRENGKIDFDEKR